MEFGGEYGFHHLPHLKLNGFGNQSVQKNLKKWSMIDALKIQAFSFNRPFKTYLHEEFLKGFLACHAVTSTLEKVNVDHSFSPIEIPAEKIQLREIKCSLTTMGLFDKITQNEGMVRKNGAIVKCVPGYFDPRTMVSWHGPLVEIEIGDRLRKLILATRVGFDTFDMVGGGDDDLEDMLSILTTEENEEFLFKLFGHLVIGGSLCQYEDDIQPYLDTVKALYKDLVAVTSSNDGQLRTVSSVYRVHSISNSIFNATSGCQNGKERDALEAEKNILFHKPELNNFFYIIVNPLKQTCYTVYHHV